MKTILAFVLVIVILSQVLMVEAVEARDSSDPGTIKLITKLCQTMPGESVICKRYSEPTETIFSSNQAIYHYRSERDNSESLFPMRSENDLVSDEVVA